jgi:acetyl esterase/lipase
MQSAMIFCPHQVEPVPLLVMLHTWSGSYTQAYAIPAAQWCINHGWAFIQPNLRGANNHPEATGSEFVIADMLAALSYMHKTTKIDTNRIYLLGWSGGAYTALLLAGRFPELWTAVSVWSPILDLRNWYYESIYRKNGFAADLVRSCGGPPGLNDSVDAQYTQRSPASFLSRVIGGPPIDINTGIQDGHTGSVPIHHSVDAFNLLASANDRIAQPYITIIQEEAQIPPQLQANIDDSDYIGHKPLFRITSNNCRLTIFEGGHEVLNTAALKWLSAHVRKKN